MVDATNTDVPDQMVPHYAYSRAYGPIWCAAPPLPLPALTLSSPPLSFLPALPFAGPPSACPPSACPPSACLPSAWPAHRPLAPLVRFVSYVLINFVLLSFVLAVVYNEYQVIPHTLHTSPHTSSHTLLTLLAFFYVTHVIYVTHATHVTHGRLQ